MGRHQLRGVNLGGWFVVEPWMTPALFAGTSAVDEHTLMETPDGPELIRRHRETFITEADFAWIAEHGLSLVRLPVGHWTLQAEPPYEAAVELLDAAMDWAHTYGLKVLLDMHGVIGSQNGRDHSGRVGPREFYRISRHREDSLEALAQLATRYAAHPALWGIELVNEPTDPRIWRLWEFHHRAYRMLTDVLVPGTRVVFSDGYLPWFLSGTLRGQPDFPVVLDCHFYQAFYPWDTQEVLRAAPGQGPQAGQADRLVAAQAAGAGGGVERGHGPGRPGRTHRVTCRARPRLRRRSARGLRGRHRLVLLVVQDEHPRRLELPPPGRVRRHKALTRSVTRPSFVPPA